MNPATLIALFLNYSRQLKFRSLFFLVIGLFIFDLIIPDFIPFLDEILLGLLTIILGRWKKEKFIKDDSIIEGEAVDENKEKE